MAVMSMIQALNSAMDVMLGRDPHVIVFGQDVGFFGGVFRLQERSIFCLLRIHESLTYTSGD